MRQSDFWFFTSASETFMPFASASETLLLYAKESNASNPNPGPYTCTEKPNPNIIIELYY